MWRTFPQRTPEESNTPPDSGVSSKTPPHGVIHTERYTQALNEEVHLSDIEPVTLRRPFEYRGLASAQETNSG